MTRRERVMEKAKELYDDLVYRFKTTMASIDAEDCISSLNEIIDIALDESSGNEAP